MLQAIGLPELVTDSLSAYEAMAVSLARDAARLSAIKAKLARNRDSTALFDTARFTRNLEAAYIQMHARSLRGEAPQSFAVERAL
jgi:predicted O-linked N-acetylglucosamine transferase (SPINDLY family)